MPVVLTILVTVLLGQFATAETGELRVVVQDATGLPLSAIVEIDSDSNRFHRQVQTDDTGQLIAKRLAFGIYRISVTHNGLAPFVGTVTIGSAAPTELRVTLTIPSLQAQVPGREDRRHREP